MGVNFKLKNPIEALHYHEIQLWLNISRIRTPKIRERGISIKHGKLDNKKMDMQQLLGSTNLVFLRRVSMRSPQRASSQ